MARTAANTSDVLARLEPWLPTLRRLIPLGRVQLQSAGAAGQPRVVWFDGHSFFLDVEPLARVCEALSLLSLLARAGSRVWKSVLLKIWPTNEELHAQLEDSLMGDCRLGLHLTLHADRWIKTIDRLYDHHLNVSEPSVEYGRVRADLETLRPTEDATEDPHEKVRLRFEFVASGKSNSDIVTKLQHIVNLAKAEHIQRNNRETAVDARTMVEKPRFSLGNVDFVSIDKATLDLDGLLSLQQLMWLGVSVNRLLPLAHDSRGEEMALLLQAIRDIAGIDDAGNPQRLGVGTISISDRYAQGPTEALISAVQHSPTVHTVEIDLGNGEDVWFADQSHLWNWIAYSIFSRYADHNVHTLKMNLDTFQAIELRSVRDILNAINPLALLRRRIGKPPKLNAPRQLVASKFMLDDHTGPSVPFHTRSEIPVRVQDTPKGSLFPYWSILLPGFGQAFVHEDEVRVTSSENVLNVNRKVATVPGFPHLDIIVSDESSDAVAELIELIGKKTKRIDAKPGWASFVADEWCERVLAACPELEELRLTDGVMESGLDPVLEAAEEKGLRLRVLEAVVETEDRAENVRPFYEAMAEPTHVLAMHLEELVLSTVVNEENATELIDLVGRMLRQNRKLLKFHLELVPDGAVERALSQFKDAFTPFETERLCIRTAPLGISAKTSFLSVVDQYSRVAASPMGKMDARVLANVLQFAAVGRVRDVCFTYDES